MVFYAVHILLARYGLPQGLSSGFSLFMVHYLKHYPDLKIDIWIKFGLNQEESYLKGNPSIIFCIKLCIIFFCPPQTKIRPNDT